MHYLEFEEIVSQQKRFIMKKWFADPLCENCNGYFENWVFGKPDDPRASSSSESCHETEYSASVSGIWGSGRPTPAYLSSEMIFCS